MNLIAKLLLAGAAMTVACIARAQFIHDPPWNTEHIERLPPEVRAKVLAMCPGTPSAGHYFATYRGDRLTLHFEHFHCGEKAGAFCKGGSQCLHQVYRQSRGHYVLTETGYDAMNE